jgi:nucleotide-binding universal stress UspA family protein
MEFRRILVPTDFSPPSRHALGVAIDLGRRFGSELRLFHARELPAYAFPDAGLPITPTVLESLEASTRSDLARLADEVSRAGLRCSIATAVGLHDQEICRHAAEWGADLIVMGTHGRTGLRHVLLGSVAEKVVRRAVCPVLTVRPHEAEAHPEV